jgi:RHS repeat-associated protein
MSKVKYFHEVKSLLPTVLFLLVIVSVLSALPLYSVSDIYDRIGIIPEHGLHGAVPEENIDLFTGNLTLRFQDIRLPGPNGFDTVVWRVYNSKILRDRLPGGVWNMQQDPYSWVGMGWSMHMGIVHNYLSTEPVIEFPDGRFETAYPNNADSYYYTRDFLKYDKTNYKLYFKDGTVWTFGLSKTIVIQGISESVRVVTSIVNSYGHTITVTYQSGSVPEMKSITDSLGRTINFILTGDRLDKISVKNTTGTTVYYNYTVGTFANSGYYKLTGYDPPEIAASTYEYDSGSYDHYELTAVNTSYGGRLEYSYTDHTFYFYVQSLDTRVVSQKKMRTSSTATFSTWTYTYPTYHNASTGTVTVDGPVYNTSVTYHAYSSASPWKIGLISKKSFSDGSYSEETSWTYREISYHTWLVLNVNMGTIKAPLIQKSMVARLGDAESTEEYLYERDAVKKYGFPTKINFYGGTEGTTLLNYKTMTYNFESDSNYASKYLLSYVKNESLYSNAGTKLKETKTTYYSTGGKYGAIDKIERWKEGSTYLAWDYTYTSAAPSSITITIDLPGTAGTETYVYSYGVLAKLSRPGYTEFSRTISTYTSDIKSETNQHGGVMGFTYDNLGRITAINMPTGFNDISATWSTTSVTISQAGNTITKYWDGLARDLGSKESGDGITLYYFKSLDAEGRVTGESKGGSSSAYKYVYTRNAAGNPKSITDPGGKTTSISNQSDYKIVTDAEGKTTVFYYYGLPGLVTQVKDALGKTVDYTYDGAGRLTSVDFNNAARPLTYYSYNGLDQVISETHPETGTIAYTYDGQANLSGKTWGGITYSYSYNSANQLTQSASGDETITYTHDDRGRVSAISSSKSWKRDLITYNKLGSITGERQTIPGLGVKSTGYGYSGNNNLSSVTYPDGKSAAITNNSLNMPETVSFNAKTLVSASAYGSLKQPTAMTIAGNVTDFSASYNNNGALSEASLKKGTTTHYTATYGYDNVGNINTLTGTAPALNATFGYDALYRLTSAVYTGGKSYAYSYDDYGNLTVAKENSTTVFSTTYTTKNQPTNTNYVYDSRGNMTSAPGFLYVWSRDNYLTSVKDKLGTVISGNDYNERGLRYHARRAAAPAIVVTSPNGGQSYQVGTAVTITWNSQGVVGNVKIDYSINNGSTWTAIIASTTNDGSHSWTIPNTPSSTCRVRVSEIDGNPSDQSDAAFTILTPIIKVVSPNGGESWEVASLHNITWTSGGVVGNVKIDYSTNNGSTWISIITSTANDGSYAWSVPNTLSTTCRVRVSELDGSPSDVSNASFSITETPTVVITFPNGGEQFEVGSRQVITWTGGETAVIGEADAVTLEYTADNGVTWNPIVSSYTGSKNYTWTVPDNVSSGCRVRVRVSKYKNGIDGIYSSESNESDVSDDVFSIVDPTGLTVTSPNGDEIIPPGKNFTIRWISGSAVDIKNVKLEYSPDNGTTYFPIADRIPNTGSYEWLVPYHTSPHCLVRISAAYQPDESNEKQPGFDLLYEFKFRVDGLSMGAGNDFSIRLGDVKKETVQNSIPSISFNTEANGKEYISCEGTSVELADCREFLRSWHSMQIMQDNSNRQVSIILDEKVIMENIPLSAIYRFNPAVSFVTGAGVEVAIDDLSVKINDAQEKGQKWNLLFNEDFERLIDREQLKDSGWVQSVTAIKEKTDETKTISIAEGFNNTGRTLRIESGGDNETIIVKSFQLPLNFPFDVSDKPFEIRYNEDMNRSISPISPGNERAEAYSNEIDYTAHGPYFPPVTTDSVTFSSFGQIQAVTVTYTDTYYIYSFDGKLLSEYDQTGSCVRDYIYAGNRLLAEYRPSTGKYYYYMSDQINSTRIITDDLGNVVYSEAYGPYGDVQKTWAKTYDPKQKFSGKEREGYSELDYFGARYFDNNSYRFISVDPVITKEKAISNPQYWNLYAYCGNNPITSFDPSGLDNYVFYDSRNFSKQANVEKKRLEGLNGEVTHLREIRNRKEFAAEWSGMNNPTEVTLLFHSGGGAGRGNTIAIDSKKKEYLVTDPSGKTPGGVQATYIGHLARQSIKELNLYVCSSAMGKNNLGETFFKTQDIQRVNGALGPFNYNRWYFFESPLWAPRESNRMVSFQ